MRTTKADKFRGVLKSLKEHGYTNQKIASLAEVDRTAVSKWMAEDSTIVPQDSTLKVLKSSLTDEGLADEAAKISEMLVKDDSGWEEPDEKEIERQRAAAIGNIETLPGALYTPWDAGYIAGYWPHGNDMEFIFAEAKYNDSGMAWDITHKGQDMLKSFQGMRAHEYSMSRLAEYGITADLIRQYALWYKNLPESAADLPAEAYRDIAVYRIGEQIKRETGWKITARGIGEAVLMMLELPEELIQDKICRIKDEMPARGFCMEEIKDDTSFWMMMVLEKYGLEPDPENMLVPGVIYSLFDAGFDKKGFFMRPSAMGRALLSWLKDDLNRERCTVKAMYDSTGSLHTEYDRNAPRYTDKKALSVTLKMSEEELDETFGRNKGDVLDEADCANAQHDEQPRAGSGIPEKPGAEEATQDVHILNLGPSSSGRSCFHPFRWQRTNMFGKPEWNTDLASFREHYMDTKNPDNNLLFGQDLGLILDDHKKKGLKAEYLRNKNVLVLGGSGMGKTFSYVRPNIAQMNSSYVVVDPAGETLRCMGRMLAEYGYEIKVFAPGEAGGYSDHYNPMEYIYDGNKPDIGKVRLLSNNIVSFMPRAGGEHDPFWNKAIETWFCFAILYVAETCQVQERSLSSVLKVAKAGPDVTDSLIGELRKKTPDLECFRFYDELTAFVSEKTRRSVFVTAAALLAPLEDKNLSSITSTSYLCERNRDGLIVKYRRKNGDLIRDGHNISLEQLGDKKTALFIEAPVINTSYDFLFSLLISQALMALYFRAEMLIESHQAAKAGPWGTRTLPVPVHFILDAIGNSMGYIPDLPRRLATCMRYGVGCSLLAQSMNKLKALYPDDWEELVGNCDTKVLLGSSELDTNKYISELLGKTTIRSVKKKRNKLAESSQLISAGELLNMDMDKEVVMVRGEIPFYISKTAWGEHPMYKETGDADPGKCYDRECLEKFHHSVLTQIVRVKSVNEKSEGN